MGERERDWKRRSHISSKRHWIKTVKCNCRICHSLANNSYNQLLILFLPLPRFCRSFILQLLIDLFFWTFRIYFNLDSLRVFGFPSTASPWIYLSPKSVFFFLFHYFGGCAVTAVAAVLSRPAYCFFIKINVCITSSKRLLIKLQKRKQLHICTWIWHQCRARMSSSYFG